MTPKLLIVDDGDRHVELLHQFLRGYTYATRCELPGPCWTCPSRPGCTLTHAHDLAEAKEALDRHPDVEVVLLDVVFDLPEARLAPPSDLTRGLSATARRQLQGLDILHALRRSDAHLPIILMTAAEELEYEDAAMSLRADEFATLAGAEAFDARVLELLIERVLARRRAHPAAGGYAFGSTTKMARLRRDAETLARTSLPMLVLGETGTGKSALVEQVIHPASRRSGPFVAVDLAALPETLVAAELFGTARGAFSGAVDRPGRFEAAHRGTLFLDEIGNLPLDSQRLLLLALEDGRVTRLGETTPRTVDVKLVAATNLDLAGAARRGAFRADLFARLNPAAALQVPPLRERMEDLPELATAFVGRAFAAGADRALLVEYCERAGLGGTPSLQLRLGRPSPHSHGVQLVLAEATLTALRRHAWPGNVRELELVLSSAAVFALADGLAALGDSQRPQPGASVIPIPARLVRDLLTPLTQSMSLDLPFQVAPQPTLHGHARSLERQLYDRLFDETSGDFALMALRLLGRQAPADARRVQLRFNQLGLRARGRSKSPK